MSADDASGPVKAAHKAAKEKRAAAELKTELFRRRAERDR